jgi:hypothetical protein
LLNISARLGGDIGPGSKLRISAAFMCKNGDGALALLIAPRDSSMPNSRIILVPSIFEREEPDCLKPINETPTNGWMIRTWELRTQELRGRFLVGVGFSPLPMTTGSIAASWVDIRLGFFSLDETNAEPKDCILSNVEINKEALLLSWECACGSSVGCWLDHVMVFVNGKFTQACGNRDGPIQLKEASMTLDGVMEQYVQLRACRRNGSITPDCRAVWVDTSL